MSMTTPRVTVPVDGEEVTITLTGKVSDTMPDRPGWFRVTGHRFIFSATGDDAAIHLSAAPAPEGGAAHYGDPCIKCGVGHDDVSPGPCRDDGITISRERANAILGYLKNGRGPAGWPTTLWCEVQAFIKNIEAALATREEAPAEAGDDERQPGELELAIHELLWPYFESAKLGHFTHENDCSRAARQIASALKPGFYLSRFLPALRAQPPAREDAQPVGWLRAVDEEMVCAHLGVADAEDSFETAKKKLASLIQWNIAVATDPSVGGRPAPDALRELDELVSACEVEFCSPGTEGQSWTYGEDDDSEVAYPKSNITFGHIRRARQALAALQVEQKGGA